ncbi:hypothetical protein EX30DRAFT_317113 [Ascodesmis nigricans]|uniref:Dipeptidase n=1 Tax=Ascodesmis nigricans TaxID=341454 RepID=A0A4S2N211_9PEZI|nr:hypothetical protein EX30DRAFT_317113 [Ascodesmis nigricans]
MDSKHCPPSSIPIPERPRTSRTRIFTALALLTFPLALWSFLPVTSIPSLCHHRHPQTPSERVDQILLDTPLIDTHIDLPISIRVRFQNHIYQDNFTFSTHLPTHVDLPRLHSGGLGGVFWSVYMPCAGDDPTKPLESRFLDPEYYQSIHDTLQQVDLVHRLIAAYPDDFTLATSPRELRAVHEQWKHHHRRYHDKKPRPIASVLGVEGLHQIGNSPAVLRMYHRLGVRYITLTHVCNNRYADGALSRGGPVWGGLSSDGREMVREMNRVGMMVDLSHTTAETMKDVLEIARAPVVFSHSGAFGVCPHERNVRDDVLRMVKENGGVVQVVFAPDFVRCGEGREPREAGIEDVVEHIMYIAELIGWEHVGIGSDYDGIMSTPKGLEDVGMYPALLKMLVERGVRDKDLRGLVGENVLRVWEEVERVAEEMKRGGESVLEDEVPPMKW